MSLIIRLSMRYFWYFLFSFLSIESSFAQTSFDSFINPPSNVNISSITNTHDNGFILCGSIADSIDGTDNFYFEKYDSLAHIQWSHQLVDSFISGYDEVALQVIQDYDNNYIFIGTVNSHPYDLYNESGYIGKFNSSGFYIWADFLYANIWSSGNNIVQTKDSGFIVMFHSYGGAGSHSERVVKYNQPETEGWYGYAGGYNFCFNDLAINQNNFFVSLANSYEYYYSFDCEYQVVISGGDSIHEWQFPFSCTTSSSLINAICPTSDNGALVCGQWNPYGDEDISVVHFSPIGDSLLTKVYGKRNFTEVGIDIKLCSDSGFIITGYTSDSCLAGITEIFLLKLNSNGDSLWYKTFGGYSTNIGYQVFETVDHGYLIRGYTHDLYGNNFIRIIKTDSSGNVFHPFEIVSNNLCPVYCNGDTAILSTSNFFSSYLWSTGDTTPSIRVTTSGIYSVVTQDSLGHSHTSSSFSVYFLAPPVARLDSFMIGCGSVTLISLATTNVYYNYSWYRNDTLLTSGASHRYNVNTSGIYKLLISDQCGIDSAESNVFIHPLPPIPDIHVSPSATFCVGDSAKLFTTIQNYSYQWYITYYNSYPIIGATDSVFYSSTEYTGFSVQITDSFGCSSTSSLIGLHVIYPNNPYLSITPNPICQGDTAIISASDVNILSYLWNTGDTINTVITTTSNNYYCILNYRYSCQYLSDTVHATIWQNPTVNLGNDTMICVPGSVLLDAGSGGNFTWQNGNYGPTYLATGFFADTVNYYVQKESYNGGCLSHDTIQIIYEICTGINIINQNNNFLIFPNPVRNILYVAQSDNELIRSIKILNSIGQNQKTNYTSIKNGKFIEVNTSSLSVGIYFFEILTDKQKIVKKFVKE